MRNMENPRNTFLKLVKEVVKDVFGMCIEYDCSDEFYAHNESLLFYANTEYTKEEKFVKIRITPLVTFLCWETSSVIDKSFISVEEAAEYLRNNTSQIYRVLFEAMSAEYLNISEPTQMKRFQLEPHPETAPIVSTASVYWWAYSLHRDKLKALETETIEAAESYRDAVKMKMVSLYKHLSSMEEFEGMLDLEPWMANTTFETFNISEELAFEWALEYWKTEEADSKKQLQIATSYFEILTHQQFLIDALTVISKLESGIKDR